MSIAAALLALAGARAHAAPEAAWLEIYDGWSAPTRGVVIGRAHRGAPPFERPGAGRLARSWRTVEALEAHPLVGARVEVMVGGRPAEEVTDARGYFTVHFRAALPPPRAEVVARLTEARYAAAEARATIAVFPPGPGIAVICDIDDTLLDTGVRHKGHLLVHALDARAADLIDFTGAAATLVRLVARAAVVYLSGSPWSFHGRIADHFRAAGFPAGPILLKRFSSEPWTAQAAYKWPHLVELADALPERRLYLIGDSGEQDPEVYARLARERPGRVAATYIHLVTDEDRTSERFRGMTVFRDFGELAAVTFAPAPPGAPPR